MNFLKDLNEQQLKAVTAPLGPVLVLAGAGSGKTRALTYRIAYLIASKSFLPHQILAVTFTNKAAKEMAERVSMLAGNRADGVTLGTFHSICVKILRREISKLDSFTPTFAIFDQDDSLKILKNIIKSLGIEKEISPNFARAAVSSIKNKQLDINTLEDENISRIFSSYQAALREINALDFDDLLLHTVTLFTKHPTIAKRYQNMWPYLLVDEYQDTNTLQYELIKLLAGIQDNNQDDNKSNIFAVGDDAQSIYGFRGANFTNILNFEKDFPNCLVVTLDENYRSSQNILNAANAVIKLSPAQKPKNLWTRNSQGELIVRHTAIDEVAEAMFVASEILKLASLNTQHQTDEGEPVYISEEAGESETAFFDSILDRVSNGLALQGFKHINESRNELNAEVLKQIAVLYRTNAQSRILEEIMLRFGIPYHLVGSVRFYERKEIKDVLSFLRLLLNPKDILSMERVINIPPRGIGERSFELIRMGNYEKLSPRARSGFDNFATKLASISRTDSNKNLVDIITILISKFNLEEYYRDGTQEGEDRWENVKELLSVASRFNNLAWQEALAEFLAEVALYSETDEVGNKEGVTLMTMHQAKGLEFDTVFIVGLEEGILPHMKSLEVGADIAEEIRLAYVGITRARKNLYLLNTHTRRIFGSNMTLKPSRILKAIPEELVEYRE